MNGDHNGESATTRAQLRDQTQEILSVLGLRTVVKIVCGLITGAFVLGGIYYGYLDLRGQVQEHGKILAPLQKDVDTMKPQVQDLHDYLIGKGR